MVLIKVKTLSHKIYEINIDEGTTFKSLKDKISEVHDQKIINHEYKIIHLGKAVNDDDEITKEYDQKLFIVMCTKKKVEVEIQEVLKNKPSTQINIPTITNSVNISQINPSSNDIVNNLINQFSISPSSIFNGNDLIQSLNIVPPVQANMNNENASISQMNNINNLVNQLNNILNVTEPNINPGEDDEEGEEGGEDDVSMPPLSPINQSFNVKMIGEFTIKEVDDINEIVNMGFDYYEVIQIYTACGKNKEDVINMLLGN
jgi:hypothetical protein